MALLGDSAGTPQVAPVTLPLSVKLAELGKELESSLVGQGTLDPLASL